MSVLPYLLVFFPDTELFCGYEFSLTSKLVTDLLSRHPWRFCPSSAFANSGGRYKDVGKKVPQAYLRYVEDTFLPCDAVDAPLFANDQLIFSK